MLDNIASYIKTRWITTISIENIKSVFVSSVTEKQSRNIFFFNCHFYLPLPYISFFFSVTCTVKNIFMKIIIITIVIKKFSPTGSPVIPHSFFPELPNSTPNEPKPSTNPIGNRTNCFLYLCYFTERETYFSSGCFNLVALNR